MDLIGMLGQFRRFGVFGQLFFFGISVFDTFGRVLRYFTCINLGPFLDEFPRS
jgi:hypothetical protein